jgi:hypothetical protein
MISRILKFLFHKHKPLGEQPLVVSGYGLTEYELDFCKTCGDVLWKKTKDFNNS